MVFLVDHHADLFALIDDDGPGALSVGMFAADELAFDEELPVDGFQRAHINEDQLPGELALLVQLLDASAKNLSDLSAVGIGCPGDEREIGEIPREPDAAADHNVR